MIWLSRLFSRTQTGGGRLWLESAQQDSWLKDDIGGVILNNHVHGESRALHCGHFRNMKNDWRWKLLLDLFAGFAL